MLQIPKKKPCQIIFPAILSVRLFFCNYLGSIMNFICKIFPHSERKKSVWRGFWGPRRKKCLVKPNVTGNVQLAHDWHDYCVGVLIGQGPRLYTLCQPRLGFNAMSTMSCFKLKCVGLVYILKDVDKQYIKEIIPFIEMISIVGTSCKRRPRSRERTTDPEPATPPHPHPHT